MTAPPITIRDGAGPPYLQVLERVRALIERGSLLPGERIPTVRSLADRLDLAPNTVARAYRALEDDGWIVGRGRAGTFVTDTLPERPVARGGAGGGLSSRTGGPRAGPAPTTPWRGRPPPTSGVPNSSASTGRRPPAPSAQPEPAWLHLE